MNDTQLNEFGIVIVEDGTNQKKYRRYTYNGIELNLTHGQIKKLNTKKLSSYIFEAGKDSLRIELMNLISTKKINTIENVDKGELDFFNDPYYYES